MTDTPSGPPSGPSDPRPPSPPVQPTSPPPPAGSPTPPSEPAAPPPPGGGAPPPPPPSGDRYDVMAAFQYAWEKFRANVGPILTGVGVLFVGSIVVALLWFGMVALLTNAIEAGSNALGFVASVLTVVGLLGYLALAFIVQAGIIRAGLAIVDGRPLEMSTLLSTDRLGTVIGASLLVGLVTAVGSVLFVLPGVIFAFLAQFFLFFVVDRGEGAWEAIMSSIRFTVDNFVDVLLLYVVGAIVTTIGALLCGIGLVVAFPVVVIAQAYTFRFLQGQSVA